MAISTTELFKIFKARGQSVACHWCGIECLEPTAGPLDRQATKDHLKPTGRCRKGRTFVLACRACNEIRGDMEAVVWVAFMLAFPNFRQMTQAAINDAKRQFMAITVEIDGYADICAHRLSV